MPVLTLDEVSLAYGDVPLLDRVTLSLDIADRVALIGRNGTGKSSLLRVAAGLVAPDDGAVWRQPDVRVAYVAQEPELESAQTVFEAVARGLGEVRKVLAAYERIAHHVSEHNDVESLQQLETLGTELDRQDGWRLKSRVDAALSRLTLDANAAVGELSGGQKKRVALAQALVLEPEMLLLDEPTNHLDIDSIAWLEALLTGFRGALLFVTHDRAFLDAVAQRVIELDRGRLSAYPGNFSAYQLSKVEQLAVEATINAKFDAVLAQEEAWIRKGVEARRTRNAGRVRRLEALRRERAARRDRQATASIAVDGSERSGQLVAELSHVDKVFGERTVVKDFSARILRGDKVGLIGPNGAGKTTLLRLILGELAPDAGYVRRGTKLSVAYYDQFRAQLDAETTVLDTIGQGSDYIEVGGARKHVLSYLGDFLFSPQRVRSPVKALSGGERNRLLLARLFAKPANLIVLDEPTNDLDLETLELLEVLLQEYSGTVLLVSHDRTFLDNVVTQVIAWESDGRWVENPGGWQEWARVLNTRAAARLSTPVSRAEKLESGMTKRVTRPGKLSYQQAQELKTLPARIEALEQEQAALSRRLGDPDLYRSDADEVRRVQARYEEIEGLLVAVLERWTWLEQQQGG